MWWRIGNPKAAVFPVPVWASETISFGLSINNGIDFVCTYVGFLKPNFLIAEIMGSFKPIEEMSLIAAKVT